MRGRASAFGAAVTAGALLLSGCYEQGGLDSNADATITGRVVDGSGEPIDGARVKVRKTLAPAEIPAHRIRVLGDLGLACVDERAPTPCWRVDRETDTAADGAFSVTMKGHDTTGPGGGCGGLGFSDCAQAMHAAATVEPGQGEVTGAAATRRFHVRETDVPLGDFLVWNPPLSLSADDVSNVLRVGPPPPGSTPFGYLVLAESPEGAFVWGQLVPPADPIRLDGRLFEDRVAALSVVALDANGFDAYRSARIPVRGGAGRPVSAGRPCGADPCALTDGDIRTTVPITGGLASDVIELAEPVVPEMIAVRGCRRCSVEVSVDGQTWEGGPIGPVLYTDPATIDALRAQGESGREMFLVTEVWIELLLEPTGDPAFDATRGAIAALTAPALAGTAILDVFSVMAQTFGQALTDLLEGGEEVPYDWARAHPNVGAWVSGWPADHEPIRFVRVTAPPGGARVAEVGVWPVGGVGASAPITVVDPAELGWPEPSGPPTDWVSVLGRVGLGLLALSLVSLVLVARRRRRTRPPAAVAPPPPPPGAAPPPPPPPPPVAAGVPQVG